MFKNKEAELLEIKQRLGAGDVYVPTELEKIMHVEVSELVSKHYDRVEGSEELFRILNNYKFKTKPAKGLLEFTDLERKYKLNRMPKTFEFTRPWPMALHYLETLFYVCIS